MSDTIATQPKELVATIETLPTDHLSVGDFATEIVHDLEKLEDLEGDGDYIRDKIMQQVEKTVTQAKANGAFQNGETPVILMAVRDPKDGDHTIFLQGKISMDENGQTYLSESTFINQVVTDAEFDEQGRQALCGFAQGIMEQWDKKYSVDENDDFVAGYTEELNVGGKEGYGYTTSIDIMRP